MHHYLESLKQKIEDKYNVELHLVVGDEKFGVFKDLDDNPVHYTMRGWALDFTDVPKLSRDFAPYVVNVLHIQKDE